MSNLSPTSPDQLRKMLFENQSKLVSEQIRSNYSQNTNNANNENENYTRLGENIRSLTSRMKNMLDSEKSSSPRPILGRCEPDENEKQLSKADKSAINHVLRSELVETNPNNVTIIQPDSQDPLHSVKTFEDLKLKPELMNGLSSMGFRKPSAIQEKALPMLLDKEPKNIIAQSQSGTGKTATFLLTMLSKLDVAQRYCQCLCIAPTRELVLQIAEVANAMGKFLSKVKITCAVKGIMPPIYNGEIDSQIVIGTPGTLKFWTTENPNLFIDAKKLKVFVLDEADVLIESGEFLNIAKRIKSKVTKTCQILLFSATYDEQIMEFAHEFVPNPTEFSVKPRELTLKNIKQFYIHMESDEEKYPTLVDIYGKKSMGQCIIFCESRRTAQHLKEALEKDSHLSSLLSGDLDVEARQKEIHNFRIGKSRVLITTNLCARGIDIPQVNLIINWNMPRTLKEHKPDCETYLHRIGRSGRFGKVGITINFIASALDLEIQNKIIEVYGACIEKMSDIGVLTDL